MPLELPTLDDRRFADLVEEAKRLIPVYDPDWTNHNLSDPGITLLELFAWLTEMLIYRLDRVTDEHKRKFLKLLNGPSWTAGTDLEADIRETVLRVRARDRAVTLADYERLASHDFNTWLILNRRTQQATEPLDEWWRITRLDPNIPAHRPAHVPMVARAAAIAARNLERASEADPDRFESAHVSVIAQPRPSSAENHPDGLTAQQRVLAKALWGWLDQRRMLTTRHHVVAPTYAPIEADLVVAAEPGAVLANVKDRVFGQMRSFLDPPIQETGEGGWPFGRAVFLSEVMEQIEAVPGVDYIADVMLTSQRRDPGDAVAQPIWHSMGELIGLRLEAQHLPRPLLNKDRIVVARATDFIEAKVMVTVTVTFPPRNEAGDGDADEVKQTTRIREMVRDVIRRFFHPLYDGPKPDAHQSTTCKGDTLRHQIVTALNMPSPEFQGTVDHVSLELISNNLAMNADLVTRPGELVNWQASVLVAPSDETARTISGGQS